MPLMQDKYVGDVGDFGKYGLLRHLCSNRAINGKAPTLGVVWYWIPSDEGNNDGKHDAYLSGDQNRRKFRECDEELYNKLISIREERRVEAVEKGDILPSSTVYYRKPVNSHDRRQWLAAAITEVKECPLVFLDPDNGIECPSMEKRKEGKYAFWGEIETLYNRTHSFVIYHHLGRNGKHEEQIKNLQQNLTTKLGRAESTPEICAFRYRRGSGRVFLIILHPDNPFRNQMREQVKSFHDTKWFTNKHFS